MRLSWLIEHTIDLLVSEVVIIIEVVGDVGVTQIVIALPIVLNGDE